MTYIITQPVTLKVNGTVTTLTPGDTIDLSPDKSDKLLKAGVITPTTYRPTPEQIERAAKELEIDPDDPVMFKGLVEMLTDKFYLDKGQVPPSYTTTTYCKGCKATVFIFDGCPKTVTACPWCHGRREIFEERAAICELDGGMSKEQAEEVANEESRAWLQARTCGTR